MTNEELKILHENLLAAYKEAYKAMGAINVLLASSSLKNAIDSLSNSINHVNVNLSIVGSNIEHDFIDNNDKGDNIVENKDIPHHQV